MRLPLPSQLQTRDGTLTKDSKMVNCFIDGEYVFKRPGTNTASATSTGQAQGSIYNINGLVYVINADVVKSYNAAFALQQTIAL